jgi:hypothetical protein
MYTPAGPSEPGDPHPDSPPDGDEHIDDIDSGGDDDEG